MGGSRSRGRIRYASSLGSPGNQPDRAPGLFGLRASVRRRRRILGACLWPLIRGDARPNRQRVGRGPTGETRTGQGRSPRFGAGPGHPEGHRGPGRGCPHSVRPGPVRPGGLRSVAASHGGGPSSVPECSRTSARARTGPATRPVRPLRSTSDPGLRRPDPVAHLRARNSPDDGPQRHWFRTWIRSGIGTPADSSLVIATPI
jgi:hypothetical protein